MKTMLKLTASLGAICLIGSAALTWVQSITREPIRQADERALTANLKMVLPVETQATRQVREDGDARVFEATDSSGALIGFAVQATGKGGFGGDVKALVGFFPDGAIRTVMISEHKETPGIGTKATDRKVQRSLWDVLKGKAPETAYPPNAFLDRFNGTREGTVQAISGATYSSGAVNDAVRQARTALAAYMKEVK